MYDYHAKGKHKILAYFFIQLRKQSVLFLYECIFAILRGGKVRFYMYLPLNHTTLQVARSFKLEVQVEPKYHPKIIGRRGAVISRIRDQNNVQIQFPDRGAEREDIIAITGYEKDAEAAKEDILRIVHELVSSE